MGRTRNNNITNPGPCELVDDRLALLLKVSDYHRNELARHESLSANVFYWTCTILIALNAAILNWLNTDFGKQNSGSHAVIAVPVVSLFIAVAATVEITRRKLAYDCNARIIARCAKGMGLFDPSALAADGQPLYPPYWANWGDKNYPVSKTPLFNYVVIWTIALSSVVFLAEMWLKSR